MMNSKCFYELMLNFKEIFVKFPFYERIKHNSVLNIHLYR